MLKKLRNCLPQIDLSTPSLISNLNIYPNEVSVVICVMYEGQSLWEDHINVSVGTEHMSLYVYARVYLQYTYGHNIHSLSCTHTHTHSHTHPHRHANTLKVQPLSRLNIWTFYTWRICRRVLNRQPCSCHAQIFSISVF